jgi:hypothetical protein
MAASVVCALTGTINWTTNAGVAQEAVVLHLLLLVGASLQNLCMLRTARNGLASPCCQSCQSLLYARYSAATR